VSTETLRLALVEEELYFHEDEKIGSILDCGHQSIGYSQDFHKVFSSPAGSDNKNNTSVATGNVNILSDKKSQAGEIASTVNNLSRISPLRSDGGRSISIFNFFASSK